MKINKTLYPFDRYWKFKNQDMDGFSRNTTRYLCIALAMGVCATMVVASNSWYFLYIRPGECMIDYTPKQPQQPRIQCHSIFAPCSTTLIVLVVSLVITISCLAIKTTTVRLRKLIEQADARANRILNMRRTTNTSRIQATMHLHHSYIISWVPYGVSRFYVLFQPTFPRFQTVTTCFRALSTVMYVVIPIIYYKMDGGFYTFLKGYFQKRAGVTVPA